MSNCTEESSPSTTANSFLESLRKFKFLKKPFLDSQNLALSKSDTKIECIKLEVSDDVEDPKKNENQMSNGSTPSVPTPTKANGDLSPPDSPVKPGKRKAKVLSSDTEDESPKRPNGVRGSKKRKSVEVDEEGRTSVENALVQLLEAFPGQDILLLQDALCRANWDVEKAKSALKIKFANETDDKMNGTTKTPSNGKKFSSSSKANKKQKKADLDLCDEDNETDEDDDGRGYKKSKLYDSDADSDEEISDVLTNEKRQVLEFLSEADSNELQQMSHCSKKKSELIIQCRPFEGWKDIVEKLENKSGIGAGILNSAQELLRTRKVAAALIKKCSKLSSQMETAVATGLSNLHKQPSNMSKNLKLSDYQLVGLNWLLVMNAHQVNGILADEMGLGKTVQTIAFLSFLKENKLNMPGKPHIVVVPSSTLENWQNEFERWSPSLKVVVYYGSQDERKCQRLEWSKEGFGDTEVVLTTYTMVTSVSEERKMFRIIPLHYAIFDEAHMLKNMYTQRFENLIRINAPNRILITGTPLQNNLLELMSLLVFVMPKMFKGKQETLKALFTKAPKQSKDDNEAPTPNFERTQIAQAKDIMKPFVLRRLKRDVLKDLPKKTDKIIKCPMTKQQESTYRDLIADFSEQANEDLKDEQSEPSESGVAMYMKLRRLANHPLLLRHHFTDDILNEMAKRLQSDVMYKDTVLDYILNDLYFYSDFELHKMCLEYKSCYSLRLPPSVMGESGKLIFIDRMVPKLKEDGHRVLIFSQFVIVLDVLEEHFKNKGYKFLRLDGSTPVTTRQDLIDEYNQDPSILIFMLSTRAGGLGINLTAADTVIIHDIDANPHNDKQAEDRCHRIGQTKPVTVMRLISEGTIEESILALTEEKLLLEQEVSSNEDSEKSEKKNVARLLKQALGLDNKSSPSSSKQLAKNNSK